MICYSQWEYKIVKDEFQVYFPEDDFSVPLLKEWYEIIPTKGEVIAYYGDNTWKLKQHFERFCGTPDVKTKINNDMYSNKFLTIWCLAIYDSQNNLVGFAAQEIEEGKPTKKKIYYYNELNDNI